jgi:hypothetical protein
MATIMQAPLGPQSLQQAAKITLVDAAARVTEAAAAAATVGASQAFSASRRVFYALFDLVEALEALTGLQQCEYTCALRL